MDKVRALAAMLVLAVGAVLLAGIIPPPPKNTQKATDMIAQSILSPTPSPSPTPVPTPAPPPVVFVADLFLSNLRGEAQVQAFHIPARTDFVELRLSLPAGEDSYPSYRLTLEDAEERVLKTSGRLHAKGSILVFRVDAHQLAAGSRYTLKVQGVTPAGEVEDLAFPEFDV
jgi:hypothetical protein